MAMARIYPGGERVQVGTRRWLARTWLVLPESMDKEDLNPDADVEQVASRHATHDEAVTAARKALDHPRQAFGSAEVLEQVAEWLEATDGVAEWNDVGDSEYIEQGEGGEDGVRGAG